MPFDETIPTSPLISILYREHAKYLNEKVKNEDLSFGLQPILITIYENEGIIQEQLAEKFHLNESTITRNLKKLEEKGFIERIPDKRKKIIKITKKGAKTARKVMDYDDKWDENIKSNLNDEDYTIFKTTLIKICEDLIFENLKTRRSIRKFKDEQITDEELKTILEAGTYAPTGQGLQSPKIVVIQNPETIKEFSAWNRSYFPIDVPEDMDPFYGAKTLLIVLADSERPTYVEDGSSVLAVLVNAAHAVGVGSCWIHRAREEFASDKGKELLKEWGIPETYEGIGHVVLGYPDMDAPEPLPRKEDYIHYVD